MSTNWKIFCPKVSRAVSIKTRRCGARANAGSRSMSSLHWQFQGCDLGMYEMIRVSSSRMQALLARSRQVAWMTETTWSVQSIHVHLMEMGGVLKGCGVRISCVMRDPNTPLLPPKQWASAPSLAEKGYMGGM